MVSCVERSKEIKKISEVSILCCETKSSCKILIFYGFYMFS